MVMCESSLSTYRSRLLLDIFNCNLRICWNSYFWIMKVIYYSQSLSNRYSGSIRAGCHQSSITLRDVCIYTSVLLKASVWCLKSVVLRKRQLYGYVWIHPLDNKISAISWHFRLQLSDMLKPLLLNSGYHLQSSSNPLSSSIRAGIIKRLLEYAIYVYTSVVLETFGWCLKSVIVSKRKPYGDLWIHPIHM